MKCLIKFMDQHNQQISTRIILTLKEIKRKLLITTVCRSIIWEKLIILIWLIKKLKISTLTFPSITSLMSKKIRFKWKSISHQELLIWGKRNQSKDTKLKLILILSWTVCSVLQKLEYQDQKIQQNDKKRRRQQRAT